MIDFDIFNRLTEAEKCFKDTRYDYLFPAIEGCVEAGQYDEAGRMLDRFPTKKELLDTLTEKLVNKSVYKTFKRISENKYSDDTGMLKGFSSLLTHAAIEVEKGNKEYRALYPLIYERIGKILYRSK